MITYFIQSGDFVKIGTTSDIQTRMKSLRHASPHPPILLNTCGIEEREAHNIASKLSERGQGEWFLLNPELRDWILSLITIESGFVPAQRMPGRPATGKTKEKISLTIDLHTIETARSGAKQQNLSLSAYIERAIADYSQKQEGAAQ